MTDKLRDVALWKLLTEARETLWQPANPDLCGRIDEALAQQDAQAVPQPPMLRWRELADYPAETGRYIVAHCGQVGGHAYYTAREGDTHYPVGWAQLPDFKPTHWLDGPRIGTGDAAPTPPAQQDAQAVPQGWGLSRQKGMVRGGILVTSPDGAAWEVCGGVGGLSGHLYAFLDAVLNAAPTPPAQEKQS